MSYYRQQLEEWLATLEVKANTVYDIGGQQGAVSGRVKSWEVSNYRILDLPVFDLDVKWYRRRFDLEEADVIFCLEVFEYLINPGQALRNISLCLKPGGRTYVTFAFVYPHHNELDRDSLRYTESGIRRLAAQANLGITNIWYRVDRSKLLQEFYAADGMKRAKQYPNHDVTGFIMELTK